MFIRKCGVVLAVMCAAALVLPVAANAQTTPTPIPIASFSSLPVHGKSTSGKTFSGHFVVNRFITSGSTTYAVGHLGGFLGQRAVRRSNLAIPITVDQGQATAAASCPILHLVLGPLNLNLLGLEVHLNTVVLNITAVSGPGNLLGNLLCDVSNLLNTSPLSTGQLTGLLNVLQSLLGTPTLLSL